MASVSSVERFLHSKRANFVISESKSQIYLSYAECEQNLDKNQIIKEEKIYEKSVLSVGDKIIVSVYSVCYKIISNSELTLK